MNYKYEWRTFDNYMILTDFLNSRQIPKENIIKIETNHNCSLIELLYIER